jgi:hypothetical protein
LDERDPSGLMGFKQGNIHRIGATAGPTPEFYGIPLNLNQTDPDIFGMATKTSLKKMYLILLFFGLLC